MCEDRQTTAAKKVITGSINKKFTRISKGIGRLGLGRTQKIWEKGKRTRTFQVGMLVSG